MLSIYTVRILIHFITWNRFFSLLEKLNLVAGLRHQEIFRVSGSEIEISNFRDGFERGEDPLADENGAFNINSVADVLKMYLRELREPLFSIIHFDQFVTLTRE